MGGKSKNTGFYLFVCLFQKSYVADFKVKAFAYCHSAMVCTTTVSQLLRQSLIRQQYQSKVLGRNHCTRKQQLTLHHSNTHTASTKTSLSKYLAEKTLQRKKKKSGNINKRHIDYHALGTTSHMFLSCILQQSLVKNKRSSMKIKLFQNFFLFLNII